MRQYYINNIGAASIGVFPSVVAWPQCPHTLQGIVPCDRVLFMDRAYLQEVADYQAKIWWTRFCDKFPKLNRKIPQIKLNNRLKTTAGRAWVENKPQFVDLSTELFWEYTHEFCVDTIPHELAHLAAYTLFGDGGHGKGWYYVIETMGIDTSRCHTMVNSKHESRKMK